MPPRKSRAAAPSSPHASADILAPPPSQDPSAAAVAPPGGLKPASRDAEAAPESESAVCSICLDVPAPEDLSKISGCEHLFCFTCIDQWAGHEVSGPDADGQRGATSTVGGK